MSKSRGGGNTGLEYIISRPGQEAYIQLGGPTALYNV